MRLAIALLLVGFVILAGCQGAIDPEAVAHEPSDSGDETSDGVFVVEESSPQDLDLDFDPSLYDY